MATKFIEPGTGSVFGALPKVWCHDGAVLCGLAEHNCEAYGWRMEECADVVIYSKLKLVRALKAAGIWSAVKAAIESAGLWDEWLVAQELSSDDEAFMTLLNDIRNEHPEINVNGLLASCILE